MASIKLPDGVGERASTDLSPGSLEALHVLRPGDVVLGLHPDGSEQPFAVAEIAPARTLDAPGDRDRIELARRDGVLRLVLCGGPYDPDRAAYEDTVVVTLRATG